MSALGEQRPTAVAIIGVGFIGVTLADALVQRGCTVSLIDEAPRIAGASATTFAWLNSHRKRPESYQALNRAGLEVWRERFGARHAAHVSWTGHSVVVSRPAHVQVLRERVAHLRSLGYPAALVPADRAAAGVPGAATSDAVAADFPLEGYCAPEPIRAALLEELRASGSCRFVTDAAVGIDGASVALRSGRRIDADRVVIAAGNGSAALTASAGFELPMTGQEAGGPAWGFLADILAPSHGVDRVISTDDVNIRPDGAHRLVAQCLDLDRAAGPGRQPDGAIAAAFSTRLRRLLERNDVAVESVRTGHRVIPADGQTVAGPLDGTPHGATWAVVTHSGITLAPLLAESIATELVEQRLDSLLSEFRPTRFPAGRRPVGTVAAPARPGEQ